MSRTRSVIGLTMAALLVPATAFALAPRWFTGPLQTNADAANGLEAATATVQLVEGDDGTMVRLAIDGIQPSLAGRTLGAHVHTGPCTTTLTDAGGHYNHGGGISPRTEVWLDFRVTTSGQGHSATHVPFTIAPGDAQSVVIHADPTAPNGAAGARLACLGVDL